jgi:hypothetical protein
MPAPKLIGVASEASWYGLPYGVLVTAATWAAQGYRVLVVDAEPADLALTSLAHAQPQRGEDASFVELLRDRGVWPGAVDVTDTLRAVLGQERPSGSVALIPAYDDMPSRRPAAPGASLVRSVRDRLQRVELGGRVADLVLVSLPPLDTPFGVAIAANLLDALVVITSAKGPALRRVQRSLAELGALRGEAMPVHLCERMGAKGRDAEADDAAWLHHLKALPELTFFDLTPADFRALPGAKPLLADFTRLAHHLRAQHDLLHPDGKTRVQEAQAKRDPARLLDGFGQLLLDNKTEALKFYRDTMAVLEGSRVAVVQAVRAVAESPVCDVNNLAYVFRYAIQKFRLAEPDPLAAQMAEHADRLLAALRAGEIHECHERVLIDVADARLHHAWLLRQSGQPTGDMELEAERLLMEAGETVVKAGDALRMALTLGTHARLAEHGRNLELARELLKLAMADGLPPEVARRHCLDVLWDFVRATDNEDFAEQHHQLTRQVLRESPGYGHANLILVYTRQGDKRTAMEHFAKLFFADREVFDLVAQDPTFDDFFEHIGSSSFYKSAPKKGAH